jgi:small-conductance mechanosensitive channel
MREANNRYIDVLIQCTSQVEVCRAGGRSRGLGQIIENEHDCVARKRSRYRLPRQQLSFFCGRLLLPVLIFLFALVQSTVSNAQEDRATVRLDGRALFQVGKGQAVTAAERARGIEHRLSNLVDAAHPVGAATVQASTEGPSVLVAGIPVLTVTAGDAEDNVTESDALAARWATVIDHAIGRARERRLSFGGRFLAETQASMEAAFARLIDSTVYVVPRALAAIVVILLFWLLAQAIRLGMRSFFRRFIEDETTESLIKQVIYYAIVAVGLIVAVDALGFEPQTVVTGLGLTGLALGFALKDIISNFVSGILILSLRPFDLGDQIVVGSTEGSVERIELRATMIRTYDGRVALVPNAEVFTSRIINNTAHPIRRGSVTAYLGYEEDLGLAIRTLVTAVHRAEGVSTDRSGEVRVKDLGKDSILLEATFWTDSRRSDFSETACNVRRAIVAALVDAGIGLPDPDRRVIEQRATADRSRGTRSVRPKSTGARE